MTEERPIVGEISEKSECEPFIFKEITWKIGDVSSLARCHEVRSPEFSFAKGTWDLSMIATNDEDRDVIFRLRRLHSSEAEQEVYFRVHLKSSYGRKLWDATFCGRHPKKDEVLKNMDLPTFDEFLGKISTVGMLVAVCRMYTKMTAGPLPPEEELVSPIASELSERNERGSFITREITWKIPDFSSLPPCTRDMRSPEYFFENSTWILGMEKYLIGSYIFKLSRLQSLEGEQEIYMKLVLKTNHGQILEQFVHYQNFTSREEEYVGQFVFNLQEELEIASDDTLIFVCRMHSTRAAVECTSQMEAARCATEVSRLSKVLGDFEKVVLNEDGSDVTLQVRGQKFQAHRVILTARSPVFASMLSHDMIEKNTGLVDIEDCEPQTFPDFLRYLYCGDVGRITSQNVCSLYKTADKYDVQDLKSECLMFMRCHFDIDNFCEVVALALQHSEVGLVKQAADFFAQNEAEITSTEKWQTFLTENPVYGKELFIKSVPANKNSNL